MTPYTDLRWVQVAPYVVLSPAKWMLYGTYAREWRYRWDVNLGRVEELYGGGWQVTFSCTTTESGNWELVPHDTLFADLEEAKQFLMQEYPIKMAEAALRKAGQ